MNHRIRIALAVLLTTLGLTFTSSASSADPKDECALDPGSLGCLRQIAEAECADHGPESPECLAASNTYLEARVASGDKRSAELTAWTTRLADRIATLERRVERQKATIKRLRERLHNQRQVVR